MPTLSIHFTGGHYHATPWDKAQNEGAVEWPPSPWRLLRALIATGYAKHPDWLDGQPPTTAKALIKRLASCLPSYKLPPTSGAHTRHYMPIVGKTTLVLDARAVTGTQHAPVLVHWPVDLPEEEQQLFDTLAAQLGYIGRAESWVECESVAPPPSRPAGSEGWTVPHPENDPAPADCDQLTLIAATSSESYTEWQSAFPKSKTKKATPAATLFDALQVETSWLQKHGWSAPPGSRLVVYDRPVASAISIAPPPRKSRPARAPVPFVLLALASSARSRSPMPMITRTLPQAELLHRAIASKIGRLDDSVIPAAELLGLDAERQPTKGHRHAHIFPLALLKSDTHIDHMLIWAPDGLSDVSQTVLRALRKTYMKGGVGEVEIRFAGSGSDADFKAIPALRPVLGESCTWESLTPLVLPRFRKKNGHNTIEGQITKELTDRGFPAPASIEILQEKSIKLRHFIRIRRDGSQPPENYGYAIRLLFDTPVSGPISLGYASHFGLGLFVAMSDGDPN